MKPPPARHITLSRVLVLALAPALSSLALGIYNLERANVDRQHVREKIDAEICATIAKIPGDMRRFEDEVDCPRTPPVPLPTVKVTPMPSASPSSLRAPATSSRPASNGNPPMSPPSAPRAGRQLVAPDATEPPETVRVPVPGPTVTVRPTPTKGPLRGLIGDLIGR